MNNIDLILKKVKKVWEAHPELRLGQMLCNVANYGALYYSTNEEIIKLLEQFYKIDTSDGFTPLILSACPKLSGLTSFNFILASLAKLGTLS